MLISVNEQPCGPEVFLDLTLKKAIKSEYKDLYKNNERKSKGRIKNRLLQYLLAERNFFKKDHEYNSTNCGQK